MAADKYTDALYLWLLPDALKTDALSLCILYSRDVYPFLPLLVVVVAVGLEAVLLLLAVLVLVLLPLPELLHLLELNLDLLEELVMMQEGLVFMMPLEDLLMMHKEDLVMIRKEEPSMMHKDLDMMYRDQVMICKEDPVMIHPGLSTMKRSLGVLLVLRDTCLQAICPMVQPHRLLLEVEVAMRHHHLEEVQTLFVDEVEALP